MPESQPPEALKLEQELKGRCLYASDTCPCLHHRAAAALRSLVEQLEQRYVAWGYACQNAAIATDRAERAEARLKAVEEALRKYGQHIHSCHMILPGGQLPEDECKIAWLAADHVAIGDGKPTAEDCDCGLTAALSGEEATGD